jgi:zinc protease
VNLHQFSCTRSRQAWRLIAAVVTAVSVASQPLASQSVDRTQRPVVPPPASLRFPAMQRFTLANGIPVYYLEDHSLPLVSVDVIRTDVAVAGIAYRAQNFAVVQPITQLDAVLTAMLPEGTAARTAQQIADVLATLGRLVTPTSVHTITQNVPAALELMADMLRHPSFPEAALARIKTNQIARIRRQREDPNAVASRVYSVAVYGAEHPYARFSTEASVSAISRDTLLKYHQRYYGPPNISIVIGGDLTGAQAAQWLGATFGDWKPVENGFALPERPNAFRGRTIYLVDRPNSAQSVIYAGNLGPNRDSPEYYAAELLNAALGGTFSSRINMNLRERRGFTYGAGSEFQWRSTGEASDFIVSTAVATSKTDSAVVEIVKELTDVSGNRPLTADELTFAVRSRTASLPLQFETIGQTTAAIGYLVSNRLPLDWYGTLLQRFRAVDLRTVNDAARLIDPHNLVLVVVGDRILIERLLKAAGIGPVVVVDENGIPVK